MAGDFFLWLRAREGVVVSTVIHMADTPTGVCFITHDDGGHQFHHYRIGSAASRYGVRHVPEAAIAMAGRVPDRAMVASKARVLRPAGRTFLLMSVQAAICPIIRKHKSGFPASGTGRAGLAILGATLDVILSILA